MKLVVCFDGTWNEVSTRTNVWKLKQDIDCSGEADTQAKYIEGIGTVTGDELLSGLFAADFKRPLGNGYRWLTKKMLNAPANEEVKIYLFGFSRGGYLAHTMSWLLSEVGVPRKFADAIPIAEAYADKDAKALEELKKGGTIPSPRIEMLGLWDAVTSPNDIYKGYHDGLRAANVKNIFHALAIDEKRKLFGAMQYLPGEGIAQRWFSGVHKDVGGGYPEDECELSDVTLDWMKRNAIQCGLKFRSSLSEVRSAYDFSALKKIHNEETALDPIENRIYREGEDIDESVRDRVKTQLGYFPAIAELPLRMVNWLKSLGDIERKLGCNLGHVMSDTRSL